MGFELFHLAKLYRIGGARLGTGRFQAIFHTVITECALMGPEIAAVITRNHPERAGYDAIATSIADVLLDIDGIELCTNKCPRRTRFLARRMGTVFAHVAHHQPAIRIEERQRRSWRGKWNSAIQLRPRYLVIDVRIAPVITAANMLDELH